MITCNNKPLPDHIGNYTLAMRDTGPRNVPVLTLSHRESPFDTLDLAEPEGYYNGAKLYYMQFGAYGERRVVVWARSFEDALEESAGYLLDCGLTGYFEDPDYDAARQELAEERKCDASALTEDEVAEHAHTDLTYTESGWIASHEWNGDDADEELTKVCRQINDMLEFDADDYELIDADTKESLLPEDLGLDDAQYNAIIADSVFADNTKGDNIEGFVRPESIGGRKVYAQKT